MRTERTKNCSHFLLLVKSGKINLYSRPPPPLALNVEWKILSLSLYLFWHPLTGTQRATGLVMWGKTLAKVCIQCGWIFRVDVILKSLYHKVTTTLYEATNTNEGFFRSTTFPSRRRILSAALFSLSLDELWEKHFPTHFFSFSSSLQSTSSTTVIA